MPIRLMSPLDIPLIRALEKTCYPEDEWWPVDADKTLVDPDFLSLVYEKDTLVGHALLDKSRNILYTIMVHPDYRRRGVASIMLSSFLKDYGNRSMILGVMNRNLAARNLYEKFGFMVYGSTEGKELSMRRPAIVANAL